ncbi:MAG: type II toxin-antitoxin system VapC family toxin [Gemmatimonadota bacterium]
MARGHRRTARRAPDAVLSSGSGTFLDTSGWLAAISTREATHTRARAAYTEQVLSGSKLVTTSFVVAEMHVLVLKLQGPEAALKFLDRLAADPAHEVIDIDRELRLAAVERWLRVYADQDFRLTDALSFEVMRRFKLRRALALDQRFVTAGYEILLG